MGVPPNILCVALGTVFEEGAPNEPKMLPCGAAVLDDPPGAGAVDVPPKRLVAAEGWAVETPVPLLAI